MEFGCALVRVRVSNRVEGDVLTDGPERLGHRGDRGDPPVHGVGHLAGLLDSLGGPCLGLGHEPDISKTNRYSRRYSRRVRHIGMRTVRSLAALALLVSLVGCGAILPGGGGAGGPGTPTATAAPVPVGSGADLPPGVSADAVDVARLADTTAGVLAEGPVRFRLDQREARPEFSLGTVYVGPRVTVVAAGPERYLVRAEEVNERGGGLTVETFENATYITGDGTYRYDGENLTRAGAEGTVGRPERLLRGYLATYLDVRKVRVSSTGDGSVLVEGEGGRSVDGTDYSVRAVVDEDGLVRSFEAIYTRENRVQFASYSLSPGEPLSPPEWYESWAASEAGNATATASGTGTPTPTPE